MTRSPRTLITAGCLALFALAGTFAHAAGPTRQSKQSAPTAAPPAHPGVPAKPEPREGLVGLVADALSEVKLDPKQSAEVEKLGDPFKAADASVQKAEQNLIVALAGQIEAGRIDPKALRPEIDGYVDARKKASPVTRSTFAKLHDILTPDQRSRFVSALEKRIDEETKPYSSGTFLDRFGADLKLNDTQKKQLSAEFDKMKPAVEQERRQLRDALDGFKGASFSVESIAPERDVGKKARERAERMVTAAEAFVRVLDPGQRKMAAEQIREAFGAKSTTERREGEGRSK